MRPYFGNSLQRLESDSRKYQLVRDSESYFVHCPDTGADAVVEDEHGEPITEFHDVQRWVASHFPGCDVRMV